MVSWLIDLKKLIFNYIPKILWIHLVEYYNILNRITCLLRSKGINSSVYDFASIIIKSSKN
jgi:hypothetical protein